MTEVLVRRALYCLTVFALAIAIPATAARAQDTLSDSAWRADRARRAAERKLAQLRLDSAALKVDTLVVTPASITLHVGDTMRANKFYDQFHVIGLTLGRDTVKEFTQTMSISRDTSVVQMRDGILRVVGRGSAELRVAARRRFNVDDVSHPITRVPISVR